MIGASWNEELGRLAGAMCNGTITADETGQLDQLLAEDEAARQFYNNYMFLHAEMYSQHASLEAVESVELCGMPSAEVDTLGRKSIVRNRKLLAWLAIAAGLVGVAAVSSWVTYGVA